MRLLRMDVRGFAQLRGRIELDAGDGRLGLVVESNETGKSTLAAALLAALFGLDGDRRHFRGRMTDVERYRPWTPGPFGLALTVRHEGEDLVIDRDLERGTVRVLRGAADVTDRFRQGRSVAVGEILTGLRREQFVASVFVGQGDVAWSDTGRLSEALQRVADSTGGRATADRAIEALDAALGNYTGVTLAGPGRVDTEIKRAQDELVGARAELEELEARRRVLDPVLEQIEAMRAQETKDARTQDELRLRRVRTEIAAIDTLLGDDDAARARVDELRRDVEDASGRDARIEAARPRIESLRRRLDLALRDVDHQEREADDVARERDAALQRARDAGLAREPRAGELDDLDDAMHRLEDAAREHEEWLARVAADREELAALGATPREATTLAERFESMDDADRVRIVGRGSRAGDRSDRRREHESARAAANRTVAEVARARATRRRRGWWVLGLAFAVAASIVLVGDRVPLPLLVQFAAPLMGVVVGSVLSFGANSHREGDVAVARAAIAASTDALEVLDAEEVAEDAAWEQMARRRNLAPDAVEDAYAHWSRIEHVARGSVVHRGRADAWREARTAALESLRTFEELFGEGATENRIGRWRDRLARSERAARDVDEISRRWKERRDAVATAEAKVVEVLDELRPVLVDVVGEKGDVDGMLTRFDAALADAHARQDVRDHALPAARLRCLDEDRRAAHERRRADLFAEAEGLAASLPGDVDTIPLGESEYEDALAEVERRARERRTEAEALRVEARTAIRAYEDRAPDLRARIEELERAERRAREFREAVTLARDTLSELARQTHRVWADALKIEGTRILRAMGGEVSALHFDENLGLQLQRDGRVITGDEARRVLSAGALDTVFLAARLAVADYLARDGQTLPLVLDDPLANADDDRTLATLRLLLDAVVPHRQVLLLVCQQSRYDWAATRLDDVSAIERLALRSDVSA